VGEREKVLNDAQLERETVLNDAQLPEEIINTTIYTIYAHKQRICWNRGSTNDHGNINNKQGYSGDERCSDKRLYLGYY
jgi:hypothetical protein